MCGIAGYWCPNLPKLELHNDLKNAVERLRHRGPDFQNVWYNSVGVGLGHSRLSILDLSEHGNQPMQSSNGLYCMVYNGEVYNYLQLRKELEKNGFKFGGGSDSEVVLNAFIHWGVDFVHRLIGMYAIAIWDESKKKLYLFRDRIGVKPLYYAWNGKSLYFASELNALCEFRHLKLDVNLQALGEYFQYGYISSPRSIYNDIYKLPPGQVLEINEDFQIKTEYYWNLVNRINHNSSNSTNEQLLAEFEDLAVDSFKLRMISDVPVGVFLSGGIDSSLVTAVLQKETNQQIHTFTIGFAENKYDESVWAKKIAEYLGTKHTEYRLELKDAKKIIEKIPSILDEPMGDSSIIPTYMVSKLAREDVKVALSADGGDELFGGYSSYTLMPHRLSRLKKLPMFVREIIASSLSNQKRSNMAQLITVLERIIGKELFSKGVDSVVKLGKIMQKISPEEIFKVAQSHWLCSDVGDLLGTGKYDDPRDLISMYNGRYEEQMMFWDFHHYLPDDILVKVDRATMSVSLEGREPMLDHRLVEFAFNLPFDLRIGSYGGKHILKELIYKYLPKELVDREKQGFSIPVKEWLSSDLSHLLDEYLSYETVKNIGLLNPDSVYKILQEFKSGRSMDANKVWLLLNFSMWYSNKNRIKK